MREILFKERQIDNGKWIEGYYQKRYDLLGNERHLHMYAQDTFIRPGKCFKCIDQRGEDATEHVYEVMTLYPYCVLLRDTRNGVRTCPGYNTLSLMLRGSEAYE